MACANSPMGATGGGRRLRRPRGRIELGGVEAWFDWGERGERGFG